MVLQKTLQWPDRAIVSIVIDEPRPGESQEVFEARMLVMMEKLYCLTVTDPSNPSMYKEPDE